MIGENIRYSLTIFAILAAILIVLAYFSGAIQVGRVGFAGLGNLAMIFQGRNPTTGEWAKYPGNSPASGSGG